MINILVAIGLLMVGFILHPIAVTSVIGVILMFSGFIMLNILDSNKITKKPIGSSYWVLVPIETIIVGISMLLVFNLLDHPSGWHPIDTFILLNSVIAMPYTVCLLVYNVIESKL